MKAGLIYDNINNNGIYKVCIDLIPQYWFCYFKYRPVLFLFRFNGKKGISKRSDYSQVRGIGLYDYKYWNHFSKNIYINSALWFYKPHSSNFYLYIKV